MLGHFRKCVLTIVELLNRRELAIKDKHSGTKTSADIVFILKFLPKQVWGQIKYRWHFMDLELVKYPSFIDSSSYMNKMCVLMRHTEYYCCQLPALKQQQIPPEVQGHALTQLLSILKKFNIFQWKLESMSFEILFEHILRKIRWATQNLTLSDEIATISMQMAPYLAKFFKNVRNQETYVTRKLTKPGNVHNQDQSKFSVRESCAEKQHKNVHQLKFKMKAGARKKTSYDKGIATDFFQKNIVLPSMEDILNPKASTLEVVNVMCISSELYLTRLVSKYRPEYRCLNHPFRKAWKQVTKVCNAQMKVSLIKKGDIEGARIQTNTYCYSLGLAKANRRQRKESGFSVWSVESMQPCSSRESSLAERLTEIVLVDRQITSNPIPRESFRRNQDRKDVSVSKKKRKMKRSDFCRDSVK